MLKICTPPPDIYSMNACIGNDLAGEIAKSHALDTFMLSYDALTEVDALVGATAFVCVMIGINTTAKDKHDLQRSVQSPGEVGGSSIYNVALKSRAQ